LLRDPAWGVFVSEVRKFLAESAPTRSLVETGDMGDR
jgi:hypothetical protein